MKITGLEALIERERLDVQQAVETALPAFEGDYQIDRIAGNLSPSAKVYKLVGGENEYVVRILDRDHYPIETAHEIQLMRELSGRGLVPPVYHASDSTGVVIMKFIKDTPVFREESVSMRAALIALAKKIRIIHTLPLQTKPDCLLASNLQKERLRLVYQRAMSHPAYQIYLQGVEYLNQLSFFIKQEVFCHNNLHKHNILHSAGESYIIDWETAGAGDPFLDLANFVTLSRFSPEQEIAFLTAYLDREPSEQELAQFTIMKQITYLRYSLGQFATINLDDLDVDTLDFDGISLATVRPVNSSLGVFISSFSMLKEVFKAARSPGFIEAIRLASIGLVLPEKLLHHRLFTFSNPKTTERAQLAIQPHLRERSAVTTFEALSGGSKQATNYKVRINEALTALRVFSDDTSLSQVRHEARLYQHAAELGIGPMVVLFDEEYRCLATSFIETPTAGWQRTLTAIQLRQLAQQIRKLHDTPFVMETPHQTPTGLPLSALAAAESLASTDTFPTLRDNIALYKRLLPMLKPEVLSHNSLSRENILFDGERFHMIDWENATISDRLYDLAFLSCYFFLTPEQENTLLTSYLGHDLTHAEDQKFYLMKLLVLSHLAITVITKCQDLEFIASLPPINPNQRYYHYTGKDKHLLNLQTDFGKYVIYQLLINEIQFIMTTGKFLACEEKILEAGKKKQPSSFSDLPLIAQRSIFTYLSRRELARVSTVSKDWARAAYSIADDAFPEPVGIDALNPTDRPRALAALKATFMPYKQQHRVIDAVLSPTIIASITPFSAGLSPWANTCKLIINDRPYVIRLMTAEAGTSSIKMEVMLMGLFSAIGVSPKIHYASDELGVIIMDYVDALPAWYREITPETLTRLGLVFNQMNDISFRPSKRHAFFANPRLAEIYARVYKTCRMDHATDPRFELFRDMLSELDRLKPLCDELTERTICHHDFNVWNLLQRKTDRSFSVIDFEFSQSGDRLFDLGSLVVFMRLNKKAEAQLLASFYGREPTEREKSKYYLFKQYAWLHYIVMGLGICKGLDFVVTPAEIDELPPFNAFTHSTVLSTPLDPHSDIGHYKLAIMFIKQAKIDGMDEEFRKAMEYLYPPHVLAGSL